MNRKQERLFTGAFLLCVCLQLAQSVHSGWFIYASGKSQDTSHLFAPSPILYAPDAYRLALPTLIRATGSALGIHDLAWVAAAFDLITGLLALYLLYLLTVRPGASEIEAPNGRTLRIVLFLAVIQFPIAWVVPWQRPETLPSALYLAFSLFALDKFRTRRSWLLVIVAAALCQGFVRADVAVLFGVSVALTGLWKARKESFSSALNLVIPGALITFVSGAVQAWMQFVRYPHLPYPPGYNPIQLRFNLTPHQLEVFTIALLPFLLFLLFLAVKRPNLDALDTIVVVAFLLYLPLWFTVGAINEIRVDVPFQLALTTVVARVSASYLSSKPTAIKLSAHD